MGRKQKALHFGQSLDRESAHHLFELPGQSRQGFRIGVRPGALIFYLQDILVDAANVGRNAFR
jgi:signal recognition particle receptor subunit beta